MKKLIIFSIITLAMIGAPVAKAANFPSFFDNLSDGCLPNGACNLCDFIQLFINFADIIVALSGLSALVMFIWGGLKMLTAYGNQASIQQGKAILVTTIKGLLIVFFAWTLVNFVVGSLYGGSNFDPWNSGDKCSSQSK